MKTISISPLESIREAMSTLDKTAEKCLLVYGWNWQILGNLDGWRPKKSHSLRNRGFRGNLFDLLQRTNCSDTRFFHSWDNKGNPEGEKTQRSFQCSTTKDALRTSSPGKDLVCLRLTRNPYQHARCHHGRGKDRDWNHSRISCPNHWFPSGMKPPSSKESSSNSLTLVATSSWFPSTTRPSWSRPISDELNPAYEVRFLEEEKPLGTIGSIALAKDQIKNSFFVTNCDILISANLHDLPASSERSIFCNHHGIRQKPSYSVRHLWACRRWKLGQDYWKTQPWNWSTRACISSSRRFST